MNFKFLFGIVLSCFLFACEPVPVVEYQVIPEPQSIVYTNGFLKLNKEVKIAYPAALTSEAELLKENLTTELGMLPELEADAKKGDICLLLNPDMKTEKINGYMLEVTGKGVTLSSNTATGIFNGMQTLRQIIQKEDNRFIIQKATVTDYPAFEWRAFMLDEGRHFKGMDEVKKLLDEMALLKMNVFQWHLTDDQGWRIEIKKYPALTTVGAFRDSTEINHFSSNIYDGKPHGGFYTQDQIKEIVAYAANRHILIVPEIEMPGHSSAAIAAYPWLGTTGKQIKVPCKFGVQYDVFNVVDPKVIAFFNDVIDEVITLFPSPVFHIGGDEVRYDQWNASPQVKAYMAKNRIKTPAELQVFFTNNISNILASKGKRMMGWNDITGDQLHEYQSDKDTRDVAQKLADGTIVQFWKGDSSLISTTIKKGYEIVNAYHIYTYLDYSYESIPLKKAYSFNPVPAGLPKEMESKVLGISCQMWGEFTPTVESMTKLVYPRLAAYAESGWTEPSLKNFERFEKALPYFLNRWDSKGFVIGPVQK